MNDPKSIKPIDQQRDFSISELFFSTTDKRGVIRYGNQVFSRIAAYPLDEMVGQPHNLIRHPDMPRCAFRLVWDYLKQNKTVAAYVKNMARDGRYYWVLALIMPTSDGYLSIRLKPSSPVFKAVQQAYAAVLQTEQSASSNGASSQASMDAGAEHMMQLLGSLGFDSYDSFMWAALSAEMVSRNQSRHASQTNAAPAAQHITQDARCIRLLDLFQTARTIEGQLARVVADPGTFAQLRDQIIPKSDFVLDIGQSIRLQSVNAEIQAARLGERALALASVAERLSIHASEGTGTVAQLNHRLLQLVSPLAKLVFNAMVSQVQIEMAAGFVHEILNAEHDPSEDANLRENLDLLFQTFLTTVRQVPLALNELQLELANVDSDVAKLDKFMHTLRFIYLAGKIETSRHSEAQSFAAIFEEINSMMDKAGKVLKELQQQVGINRQQISQIGQIDDQHFDDLESLLAA